MRRLVLLLALAGLLAAPPAASAHVPLRGVQLHSMWESVSWPDMDRDLDLAARAGSNVVRVDVVWGSLELQGRGQWAKPFLAKLDHFMAGAAERHMKVLATLVGTPCWASSAPATVKQSCRGAWWDRGVGNYPPSDPADYAEAAAFLAGRYADTLAALEVWNEPNLDEPGNSWQTRDKAGDYIALLREAYPAIKAAAPSVPVLAGALAYADRPFLDALYDRGLKGIQDGISLHPYNEWRAPEDRWQAKYRKYAFLPGLEWVREAQVAHGESANGLWVTEFGWTTAKGTKWGVSRDQQADFIRRGFAALEDVDYIRAASVYNLRAKRAEPVDHEGGFGLVDFDFTPKPGYAGLAAALGGAPAPAPSASGSPGTGAASRRPPSAVGARVAIRLRQRSDGRLVATARVAPRRVVLLETVRCGARGSGRVRVTASRTGRIARTVGTVSRPHCRVVAGRIVARAG